MLGVYCDLILQWYSTLITVEVVGCQVRTCNWKDLFFADPVTFIEVACVCNLKL